MHCLREYPMIHGAKAVYDHDWDGTYPAPKGATVSFVCENNQEFVDGSQKHMVKCAIKKADMWYMSRPFYLLYCKGAPAVAYHHT